MAERTVPSLDHVVERAEPLVLLNFHPLSAICEFLTAIVRQKSSNAQMNPQSIDITIFSSFEGDRK